MASVKTYTFSDVSLYATATQNALIFDEHSINQNILLILMTPIRSAWFNPTIGSMIPTFLFEPVDDFTSQKIRSEILTVLPRNMETRVVVEGCVVLPDPDRNNFYISITYNIPALDSKKIIFNFNLAPNL